MHSVERKNPKREQVKNDDERLHGPPQYGTNGALRRGNGRRGCASSAPARSRAIVSGFPSTSMTSKSPGLRVRPVIATRAGCATAFMGSSLASIQPLTAGSSSVAVKGSTGVDHVGQLVRRFAALSGTRNFRLPLSSNYDVSEEVDDGVRQRR